MRSVTVPTLLLLLALAPVTGCASWTTGGWPATVRWLPPGGGGGSTGRGAIAGGAPAEHAAAAARSGIVTPDVEGTRADPVGWSPARHRAPGPTPGPIAAFIEDPWMPTPWFEDDSPLDRLAECANSAFFETLLRPSNDPPETCRSLDRPTQWWGPIPDLRGDVPLM